MNGFKTKRFINTKEFYSPIKKNDIMTLKRKMDRTGDYYIKIKLDKCKKTCYMFSLIFDIRF